MAIVISDEDVMPDIVISNELIEYAADQARETGFHDAAAYIEALLRFDQAERSGLVDYLKHPKVEQLLADGLESGDLGPMNPDDWKKLHERVKRHTA
jgi:hypothetical protein